MSAALGRGEAEGGHEVDGAAGHEHRGELVRVARVVEQRRHDERAVVLADAERRAARARRRARRGMADDSWAGRCCRT